MTTIDMGITFDLPDGTTTTQITIPDSESLPIFENRIGHSSYELGPEYGLGWHRSIQIDFGATSYSSWLLYILFAEARQEWICVYVAYHFDPFDRSNRRVSYRGPYAVNAELMAVVLREYQAPLGLVFSQELTRCHPDDFSE